MDTIEHETHERTVCITRIQRMTRTTSGNPRFHILTETHGDYITKGDATNTYAIDDRFTGDATLVLDATGRVVQLREHERTT